MLLSPTGHTPFSSSHQPPLLQAQGGGGGSGGGGGGGGAFQSKGHHRYSWGGTGSGQGSGMSYRGRGQRKARDDPLSWSTGRRGGRTRYHHTAESGGVASKGRGRGHTTPNTVHVGQVLVVTLQCLCLSPGSTSPSHSELSVSEAPCHPLPGPSPGPRHPPLTYPAPGPRHPPLTYPAPGPWGRHLWPALDPAPSLSSSSPCDILCVPTQAPNHFLPELQSADTEHD